MELGSLNNLAWMLATSPQASQRNGARSLELALQANQLSGDKHPIVLHTLAAAYAECGRITEAVGIADRALVLANEQSNSALAATIQKERDLYLAGKPMRESGSVAP